MLLTGTVISAAMLVAAACGSGGTTPGSAGATSPQGGAAASPSPSLVICQDVDRIRATLHSLAPVKGSSLPSSSQLQAAAQEIKSSLSSMGNRTEWQTQIDNLKAAAANLRTAAESLAASPGARGVSSDVRIAVAQANAAIRQFLTAVGSRCPSPSATPS
jgi:hypothetical protein